MVVGDRADFYIGPILSDTVPLKGNVALACNFSSSKMTTQ